MTGGLMGTCGKLCAPRTSGVRIWPVLVHIREEDESFMTVAGYRYGAFM